MKILEIRNAFTIHKIICFIVPLSIMLICFNEAMAQIVSNDYKNMDMEKKVLIVAPVVINSAGDIGTYSMDEAGKFVRNSPSWEIDDLRKSINKLLPMKIRKHSRISRVYGSDYTDLPRLVQRSLPVNDQEFIDIELPDDGSKVDMVLKGQNLTEPDFILFIEIASFTQGTGITALTSGETTKFIDMIKDGWVNMEKVGWRLLNFNYVFWDNIIGKIAAYREGHLYLQQLDASDLSETPMANMEKNADFLARFILSRTPFANPSLPYVD